MVRLPSRHWILIALLPLQAIAQQEEIQPCLGPFIESLHQGSSREEFSVSTQQLLKHHGIQLTDELWDAMHALEPAMDLPIFHKILAQKLSSVRMPDTPSIEARIHKFKNLNRPELDEVLDELLSELKKEIPAKVDLSNVSSVEAMARTAHVPLDKFKEFLRRFHELSKNDPATFMNVFRMELLTPSQNLLFGVRSQAGAKAKLTAYLQNIKSRGARPEAAKNDPLVSGDTPILDEDALLRGAQEEGARRAASEAHAARSQQMTQMSRIIRDIPPSLLVKIRESIQALPLKKGDPRIKTQKELVGWLSAYTHPFRRKINGASLDDAFAKLRYRDESRLAWLARRSTEKLAYRDYHFFGNLISDPDFTDVIVETIARSALSHPEFKYREAALETLRELNHHAEIKSQKTVAKVVAALDSAQTNLGRKLAIQVLHQFAPHDPKVQAALRSVMLHSPDPQAQVAAINAMGNILRWQKPKTLMAEGRMLVELEQLSKSSDPEVKKAAKWAIEHGWHGHQVPSVPEINQIYRDPSQERYRNYYSEYD